jgi:outer membrane translocation and assembly module TamA
VDWGEVAVGAGLGLRLGTPIGPVYVEAAWPVVDPAEQGRSTQYYFGIGRTF